jgi:hypothetical protein
MSFQMPSNKRFSEMLLVTQVLDLQVATLVTVYAKISFASISAIGWRWAGAIWLYSLVFYVPLDLIKIAVRYILSGKAWNLLFDRKVLHCTIVLLAPLVQKSENRSWLHCSWFRLHSQGRTTSGRRTGTPGGRFPIEMFSGGLSLIISSAAQHHLLGLGSQIRRGGAPR